MDLFTAFVYVANDCRRGQFRPVRRRATSNRILNVLRAGLNHGFRTGQVISDSAWRRVRPFREVDKGRLRFLDRDECRRLDNACQGALRILARGALHSGARFGELRAALVGDYHADSGTFCIPHAKGGRGRHIILSPEGMAFFSAITAGRPGDTLMFVRDDGSSWGPNDHSRPMRAALAAARIPNCSFHTLRHTHASLLAQAGIPLAVIAQNLGHTSTKMSERYSHLSPSHAAEMIRRCEPLGLAQDSNLVPLGDRR